MQKEDIKQQLKKQGDLVRKLKAESADKVLIKNEIKKLLDLKKKFL